MKKNITIILLFLFVLINPAYAYLDPGTGSIIIQAILGFIAAAFVSLSIWWQKIKNFISSFTKSEKKDDNKDASD